MKRTFIVNTKGGISLNLNFVVDIWDNVRILFS